MALDLRDPDLTVDIAFDGQTRFNEGINCDLEEFEVRFDRHGGRRLIPRCNGGIEPTKQAGTVYRRTCGHSL